MKICLAGKNEIVINALHHLLNLGIDKSNILACFNKTDNGLHTWQPSFKAICQQLKIQESSLSDLYPIKDLFFFSLEFDQIILPLKFSTDKLFNVHFSKLPAYKGMFTSVLPLLHGESESGVTLHQIDRGIDTGDVIDQSTFKLSSNIKASELYGLYLKEGTEIFKENIQSILKSDYTVTPQKNIGASYFSKSTISFDKIIIDLNKTCWEVHNQIRAFAFRAYQLPDVFGQKISHSIMTTRKSDYRAGKIVFEDNNCIEISTIDFNIILYKDRLSEILNYAKIGEIKSFQLYQEMGYNLQEKNHKGWSPLIVSAYNEKREACGWLLNNGADPNTVNNNGTSPLMYAMTAASKSNRLDIMEVLLIYGANPCHKDFQGKSLFSYAQELGNKNIIKFLKVYNSQNE